MRKILTIVAVMMSVTCLPKNWQGKEINLTDSIRHYQQKLGEFSDNAQITEKYLAAALSLCSVCQEADSIALGEQTAATALVRGSALADSCWQAAALFSMLAYFYEQRGDTVMPEHFHKKSQVLMIRNAILKHHADSVEYYNRRLNDLLNMRYQQQCLFSRKNRNFAFLADECCAMISDSGNTLETIHVGEQQLKLVRDSAFLATEDVCSETYYRLICAHAMTGHTTMHVAPSTMLPPSGKKRSTGLGACFSVGFDMSSPTCMGMRQS